VFEEPLSAGRARHLTLKIMQLKMIMTRYKLLIPRGLF
jgi:hypothetical protein